MSSRRKFLLSASAITIAPVVFSNHVSTNTEKLTHHVFFWLKNQKSKEDLTELMEGLRSLKKIKSLRGCKIGIPASTEKRDVVDSSYSISLLIFFEDVKGHDEYQVDPIHTRFVEKYSHLWSRVVVYDSVDV
ncbi:MAG: Dabb family protein [Flammeovirgaceae bacterium]